jgi:O-antigen ligase
MLEAGARMTAAHPLVGLGPEMAEQRYPIYRHPTASRLNVPHLHNSFVQIAAERGLPALLALFALLGVAARAAWRAYRAELAGGGARSDLHLGALAGLAAFCLAGLFENNWGDTEVQRMALFLLVLPFCLRELPVATGDGGADAGSPASAPGAAT